MNPAVLVILWIRLSVILAFPTAFTKLRTMSKVFRDLRELTDISNSFSFHDYSTTDTNIRRTGDNYYEPLESSTIPYVSNMKNSIEEIQYKSNTSPLFSSPNNVFRRTQESSNSILDTNDTKIISIVRVSSTSVVKPKVVRPINERISVSFSTNVGKLNDCCPERGTVVKLADVVSNEIDVTSYYGGNGTTNKTNFDNLEKFEKFVTPFVSLLRKSRLDIDENNAEGTPRTSPSSANYRLTETLNLSSFSPLISRYFTSRDIFQRRKSKSSFDTTDTRTEQYTTTISDNYQTTKENLNTDNVYLERTTHDEPEYAESERVYGEPEKSYGEPEKMYGEPEKIYGEPEKMYEETEKNYEELDKGYHKSEISHDERETEFEKQETSFEIPESLETNSKSYSSYTSKINDKKSSYIVDNGTYRKYRVEEKTPDGFIVGEYGMVSHQDGSLRGVRYTADSNINPSLIYETLVKFLSLK